MPKKIPTVFHNGSNYAHLFIIKGLAEEFKIQFTCLGQSTYKIYKLYGKWRKKYKQYNYHNLLIAQDLLQAHYQILSIIFLKEFIELNVNTDMMLKKCETGWIK